MKCEFFIKHSRQTLKKIALPFSALGMLGIILLQPYTVNAQMFSVDNDPGIINVPNTAVYVGFEPATFEYRGPITGGQFEFNGPLIRFRLESPGVNLFLATGGKITGIDNTSYFDAGVRAGYGLTVLKEKRIIIQVPLQLITSITSVTNRNLTGIATQFQQGGLVAGAGGYIGIRPAERFRFQVNMIPSYGFAFATGNTFGGSLYTLEGQARLFVDRVFGELGLSIGYDYTFKRFDISENEFDYDFSSHSFLVGITF